MFSIRLLLRHLVIVARTLFAIWWVFLKHTHTHTHTHTYIYMHIYTHMHTYIHTYIHSSTNSYT